MAKTKTALGHSVGTDRVYVGKQTLDGVWKGKPQDVTAEFISTALSYFSPNTARGFKRLDGTKNLIINVKVDKESIQNAIAQLEQELKALEP